MSSYVGCRPSSIRRNPISHNCKAIVGRIATELRLLYRILIVLLIRHFATPFFYGLLENHGLSLIKYDLPIFAFNGALFLPLYYFHHLSLHCL